MKLAVYTSHPELEEKAKHLAAKLHLPFENNAEYTLLLTPDYLGLQSSQQNTLPTHVDFNSKTLQYRRKNLSLKRELLARALGLKGGTNPSILDATAGLAQDSFILAALGFHVQLVERSPIVSALVSDAMERARKLPTLAPIIDRMQLIEADAITYLSELKECPQIIYIDPMFPSKKKSALSKKEMRVFHDIVGDDLDADALFHAALTCATERVVVKRPRLAHSLAGTKPSFSMTGSSSRFDIYIKT